jgi:hypothetical protein
LGDEEIKLFLVVLNALMRQVPAPSDCRKAYLSDVEKRLRNNGADFLSKSRSFPLLGLKLLGNDRTGFPVTGFKQQSGKIYPKLFAWYWSELERHSKINNPTKADALYVRKLISVLAFSKMLRTSSVRQISKALSSFEERVSPSDAEPKVTPFTNLEGIFIRREPSHPSVQKTMIEALIDSWSKPEVEHPPEQEKTWFQEGLPLMETLGADVNLAALPKFMDLDSFSSKPSALRDQPIEMPEWFRFHINGTLPYFRDDEPKVIGFKPPPYGKVHVLTEFAGKLRLIVPYNTPFVHSTGLFSRCRAILAQISEDYSTNQADGHRFVQRETAKKVGGYCVSADLTAFTDSISTEACKFGLSSLDLTELSSYLFDLPVSLPNGKIFTPNKLLMGLKGCFEFGTLLHHYIVRRSGIVRYALCGDDLFFRGDPADYISNLKHFGPELNRDKTVISMTAAIFCGEYYWYGHRVKPVSVKVSALFRNGNLRDTPVLFSVTRSVISALNELYRPKLVSQISAKFFNLLRRRWRSAIFPTLPQKLGGMGLRSQRTSESLCTLLSRNSVLRCSKLSIGCLQERPARSRWFQLPLELSPSRITTVFPFLPSLLSSGASQLDIPEVYRYRKDVNALNLYDVLEWYYYSTRLEFERTRKLA